MAIVRNIVSAVLSMDITMGLGKRARREGLTRLDDTLLRDGFLFFTFVHTSIFIRTTDATSLSLNDCYSSILSLPAKP